MRKKSERKRKKMKEGEEQLPLHVIGRKFEDKRERKKRKNDFGATT